MKNYKNIDYFFKDKNGKIVIFQSPNKPIITAFLIWILNLIVYPNFVFILNLLFYMSLTYWAYLEIRFGVNGFRKSLGWFVIIYISLQLIYL